MQLRILTLYEEDLEVPEMAMDFLPWVYLWTVLNFLGNRFSFFFFLVEWKNKKFRRRVVRRETLAA